VVAQNQKRNFFNLTGEMLTDFLLNSGEPKFRKDQIWEGVYQHLWSNPDHFFNIPKNLRLSLSSSFDFENLEPVKLLKSSDKKTEKMLFQTRGGAYIETVLMNYRERHTVCISSQSGCPVGCLFCATGQMGFIANLTQGEIIEQVIFYARNLKDRSDSLTNVVIMGMGEPFLNYENTLGAIQVLNDPLGFGMSARRFTISTVGIIPGIERFTKEKSQVNLAVSLHAPNDDLRDQLIPINKKYPIADLLFACREYIQKTGRRITFEYALINGLNDSPVLARELAVLLRGILCHVNLIQLNSSKNFLNQGSDLSRAKSFLNILQKSGIPTTLRMRMGLDIKAGCGQLAFESSNDVP
jgi:23S rRNA (adenine2503-C2)-methyltransferase